MNPESSPRIEARPLATPGTLAADALAGLPAAAGLFRTPPGALRPAENGPGPGSPVTGGADTPAPLPVDAFTCASDAAADKLALILGGEGFVVTTGQQPGLFLGPLYTIYKAVTAVRVAEEVERLTGRPALATFWVASDDHDWEEVAACRIVGPGDELLALRLEAPDGWAGRSVGMAPLPPAVTPCLDRLRAGAGGAVAGAASPWFDALRDAYRPGRSFGEAFSHALRAAMEGADLAILDSAHPALRARAATVYAQVLESPDIVTGAMSAGRAAVHDAGYAPALTPPEDGLQIFFDDGRARRHILRTAGGFDLGSNGPMRGAVLRERLAADPSAFSPAAALRPVLESRLLPVAASVLGPGEISYWAQLQPLFRALDVPMPAIVPRDAWRLIEPRIARLLDRLDVDAATVETLGEGIDARRILQARPPAVNHALESFEAHLAEGFADLGSAVDRDLPGLRDAAGKARHRVEQAIAEFSRTVDARVREREAVALGQMARLRAHLLPGGVPQERAVAAAQFLVRHGHGLVQDLLAASRVAGAGGQD